jgi:hypothetical protein
MMMREEGAAGRKTIAWQKCSLPEEWDMLRTSMTEVLLAWGVGHVKDKLDRVVPRPREERNLQNEYSQVILCRLLTY